MQTGREECTLLVPKSRSQRLCEDNLTGKVRTTFEIGGPSVGLRLSKLARSDAKEAGPAMLPQTTLQLIREEHNSFILEIFATGQRQAPILYKQPTGKLRPLTHILLLRPQVPFCF